MTSDEWLEKRRINGGPHGFECVGRERMAQVWAAAQADECDACLLAVRAEAISEETEDDEDRAYNAAIFDAASALISRKRRIAKEPKAG